MKKDNVIKTKSYLFAVRIVNLYKFLTDKNKNGYKDSSVKWNFQKYLIDENGYLVKIISSRVKPDDPSVLDWIKS